ncbi:hypothetical protein NM688_g7493 [Phlebia brevispora]|uniref:Uncharacterized protein n=1 Tax=Phlebia brevispora TaxID=194682 RepID=A0ACC1S4M0_9APHY|nr:hypothetical protein NM688_g7493 [Phlebia brevispora]
MPCADSSPCLTATMVEVKALIDRHAVLASWPQFQLVKFGEGTLHVAMLGGYSPRAVTPQRAGSNRMAAHYDSPRPRSCPPYNETSCHSDSDIKYEEQDEPLSWSPLMQRTNLRYSQINQIDAPHPTSSVNPRRDCSLARACLSNQAVTRDAMFLGRSMQSCDIFHEEERKYFARPGKEVIRAQYLQEDKIPGSVSARHESNVRGRDPVASTSQSLFLKARIAESRAPRYEEPYPDIRLFHPRSSSTDLRRRVGGATSVRYQELQDAAECVRTVRHRTHTIFRVPDLGVPPQVCGFQCLVRDWRFKPAGVLEDTCREEQYPITRPVVPINTIPRGSEPLRKRSRLRLAFDNDISPDDRSESVKNAKGGSPRDFQVDRGQEAPISVLKNRSALRAPPKRPWTASPENHREELYPITWPIIPINVTPEPRSSSAPDTAD